MGDPYRHYFPSNSQLSTFAGVPGTAAPGAGTGLTEAAANALYRRLDIDVPQADIDGFDAAVNALVLQTARAGNTERWAKNKLPSDTLYGSIGGVGDRLPTEGASLLVNDYFLLRRGYTEGTPPNTTDYTPGLYRRTTTGWYQVAGPATVILTQADVDGRIRRPARIGNISRWGKTKLPADTLYTASVNTAALANATRWAKAKLPADIAYTGAIGSGDRLPATGLVNDYFLLRRGYDTGIPPNTVAILPGIYRRTSTGWVLAVSAAALSSDTTTRWPKSKLPADTVYGTISVGDRLPTTGFLINDFFLLRRGYTTGTPPNTTDILPGLYRRTSTGWIMDVAAEALSGNTSRWAKSKLPSDVVYGTGGVAAGAATSITPSYTRSGSNSILSLRTTIARSGVTSITGQAIMPIASQAITGNTGRWPKSKLPSDVRYTGDDQVATSVTPSWVRSGSNSTLAVDVAIARRGLTSITGRAIMPIASQAITGNTGRWAKSKLPTDTVYGSVAGVGDSLPTTGLLVNDFFLLRRGYTEGTPPNTTDRTPGIYRRTSSGWVQVISPTTNFAAATNNYATGITLAYTRSSSNSVLALRATIARQGLTTVTDSENVPIIAQAIQGNTSRWAASKVPSNLLDGASISGSTLTLSRNSGTDIALTLPSGSGTSGTPASVTPSFTRTSSNRILTLRSTIARSGLTSITGQAIVPIRREAISSNLDRWALSKLNTGLVTGGSISGSTLTLTRNGGTNVALTLPSGGGGGTDNNNYATGITLAYTRASNRRTASLRATITRQGLSSVTDSENLPIAREAIQDNLDRWAKSKLPSDIFYGTPTNNYASGVTLAYVTSPSSSSTGPQNLDLRTTITRQGLGSITDTERVPISRQALVGNTNTWPSTKINGTPLALTVTLSGRTLRVTLTRRNLNSLSDSVTLPA